MNSASVSSFFSRDIFLRTQARSNGRRLTHTRLLPATSTVQDTLSMIEEEREPRASSSNSPSLGQCTLISPGGSQPKLKRRHANMAGIQSAVIALLDDSHFDAGLLSSPRPAPRPPVSPPPNPILSPNPSSHRISVRSSYTPKPTHSSNHYRVRSESPTPSMSSCSSKTSSETQTPPLSMTPSSSDDESFSYYDSPVSFSPAVIKPLVITKHNRPAASHGSPPSLSKAPPKRPLPPLPMPEEYSDSESDSEWYSREFSKILTLRSPALPNPSSQARPDSLCISDNPALTPKPPIPTTPGRSTQLDPSFPHPRNHISIPDYPPPPVPTSPRRVSATPLLVKTSKPRSNLLTVTPLPRRPPPRSSIPADCVLVDDTFAFSDDDASVFSLSLYDHSPLSSPYSRQSFQSPRPSPFPPSFPSTPSSPFLSATQEGFDFPIEDIRFDTKLDPPVMPSLDFPTSPVDLEADFISFEQLRKEPHSQAFASQGASAADDSRELRSRWSSSTLGSVQEEHSHRSAIGLTLRAYFSSSSAKSKMHNSPPGRHPGQDIPKTLMRKSKQAKWESDVMVIGYGHDAQQCRGRGNSSPYVRDLGIEEGSPNTSRKKLIPVEMLRF